MCGEAASQIVSASPRTHHARFAIAEIRQTADFRCSSARTRPFSLSGNSLEGLFRAEHLLDGTSSRWNILRQRAKAPSGSAPIHVMNRTLPSQVRKNTNRSTPRIKTARPVEATSRATALGSGFRRADVAVALPCWPRFPWCRARFCREVSGQRLISDDVPGLAAVRYRLA